MENIGKGRWILVLVITGIVVAGGLYFGLLAGMTNNNVEIKNGFRTFGDAPYAGKANPNQQIWITIALKWQHNRELNHFLGEVNNVRSPMYHKYMSYNVFKKYFAPPKDIYVEMLQWLRANNIHVEKTYALRNAITIHDKIGKISQLFGIQMGEYRSTNPHYKSEFFAAMSAPRVPAKFAPYIYAITGLDNATRFHLDYYHSSSGRDYLTGADVARMYKVYELYNNTPDGSASSHHIFAKGLRVATVLWEGDAAPYDPDAVTYYYQHVIPKWIQNMGVMSTVHSHGMSGTHAPGSNTDGQVSGENELDLEMVGTLAPGVDAYCVYGPGNSQGSPTENNFPDNEYNYILNTLASDNSKTLVAVSNSWGDGDTSGSAATDNDVKALNAMGVTVLASSGDDGDTTSPSYPSVDATDTYGFIAVAGTTPYPNGYDITSLNDAASMGYNTNLATPRSNEVVWYDASSTNSQGDHWGTQSGISSSYSQPSWQKNYIGTYSGRVTADIAAMGNHTLVYLSDGSGNTKWGAIAGTSVACPVVAGMIAEMDAYIGVQYRVSNHGLGFLLPTIYKLGYDYYHNGKYTNNPPFYDVTQGSTGSAGSAGTGWDQVSGWGVPNAWEFLHDISFTLSASSTSASINAGDSATYHISAKFPYDWSTEVGHFAVSGLPSGATYSFSENYVYPSGNGATASTTLTIQTTSSVASGDYTLAVKAFTYNHTTGHWGNLSAYLSLQLTVGNEGGGGNTVPGAPTNLQATAGNGYVVLTWSAPSSNGGAAITGYNIYRGTTSDGESSLTSVSGSVLTYNDTAVTNGQTYYYYVTAVNSVGESAKSNEVSATPQASTPTVKNILLVDDDGGKNYETYFENALKDAGYTYDVWDTNTKGTPSASELENYKVVIWNIGALWQNTLTSDEQSVLSTYLNNGGKLYLSSQDLLWDLSGGNDGSISNTFVNNYLKVTAVKNDVAYSSVKGVSGDPISGGFSSISLSYPFTNYADEITVGSGASVIFMDSSNVATADRYNSGTYRVVFTAFSFEAVENESSNTGASLMKSIVEWLLNGGGNSGGASAPDAPENLAAIAGDGYVKLTWNAPSSDGGSSITTYRVYRGTSSGEETYLAQVDGNTYTYKDTSVSNGQTYYYYVTAVNSVGESQPSSEVSATPQSSSTPSGGKILFVDDDDGSDASDYFITALNAINVDYDVWNVSQKGSPSYDDLKDYAAVIWSTGYAYQNTLTSDDMNALMQYLDKGGRFYLSSQDFLWEISDGYDGAIDNIFVNNYLGVSGVNNDIGYSRVYGVSGDPITGNMGTVYFDYPYDNYADEITLESGAHTIFTDDYGEITADSYSNGNYKVVFTAFSFEAVEKYDPNTGATLMQNIVNWLLS